MKKCSYCGRQNEDAADTCSECGTEIASSSPPQVDAQLSDSAGALVIVGRFATISEACLLKTRLETAGIEACIPEEYACQVFSNVTPLGSVTVRVAAKDSEAAKGIAAAMAEPSSSVVPEEALEGGLDTAGESIAANTGAPTLEKGRGKPFFYIFAIAVAVGLTLRVSGYYRQNEVRTLLRSGLDYGHKGEFDKAINDFSRAIQINPRDARLYHDRGYAYEQKGEWDKAILDLSEAIRLNPENAKAYASRGRSYCMKGELEKALADVDTCIRLAPERAENYGYRAYVLLKKADFDKAISDLDESLQLNPNDFRAYDNRGYAHLQKGELDKAINDFSEGMRLQPTNIWSYCHRGAAFSAKGDFDKAMGDFNEALHLSPDSFHAYNALAWFLATCPNASIRDGRKAVELANRACELSDWKQWACIGTLGAAYAEEGDFEKAVKYQKQALSMGSLSAKDRADAQQQLDLYQQHQAYHESPK